MLRADRVVASVQMLRADRVVASVQMLRADRVAASVQITTSLDCLSCSIAVAQCYVLIG